MQSALLTIIRLPLSAAALSPHKTGCNLGDARRACGGGGAAHLTLPHTRAELITVGTPTQESQCTMRLCLITAACVRVPSLRVRLLPRGFAAALPSRARVELAQQNVLLLHYHHLRGRRLSAVVSGDVRLGAVGCRSLQWTQRLRHHGCSAVSRQIVQQRRHSRCRARSC